MAEHAAVQPTPKKLALACRTKQNTWPQSPEHCGPPKAASQVRVEWITKYIKMIYFSKPFITNLEIEVIQKVLRSGVLTDGFYQNLSEKIIKKRLSTLGGKK